MNTLFRLTCMLLLMSGIQTGDAQPAGNQPVNIVLKTAQTLFQSRQYEAALDNFKKVLQQSKASKNNFLLAQAWEGLANVYHMTRQQTEAVVAYQNAIRLYKTMGYPVIADLLNTQMRNMLGLGDLYAGIEIGSNGIILRILELKPGTGKAGYTLKMDSIIHTEAGLLSYQSEKETRDAIRLLAGIASERFEIPPAKTWIVISGQLKQELDQYNKAGYFTGVIRPQELNPKIKIDFLTAEQETALYFKGIVPLVDRSAAGQLDLGPAACKNGYWDAEQNFASILFPVGTGKFRQLLDTRVKGNPGMFEYKQAAEKLIVDSLGRMINYVLRDHPDFKPRDLYLTGDIAWSIVSLLYPEKIRQEEVLLTLQDILDFQHMLVSDFEILSNPELSKSLSVEEAAATRANIKKVLETNDARTLLAGSVWLGEWVKQLNQRQPDIKMFFPRYASPGWMSGYILDQITRQYSSIGK